MHAQHMDIILIFARTRDVGLCRPCLHEKKTDMEQFGKILIVDDNEDVLFALNLLLEPYAEKIKVAVTPDRIEVQIGIGSKLERRQVVGTVVFVVPISGTEAMAGILGVGRLLAGLLDGFFQSQLQRVLLGNGTRRQTECNKQ